MSRLWTNAGLCVGLALLCVSCQVSSILPPNALKNPRGLALVCRENGQLKAPEECSVSTGMRALVTGGSVGSISVAQHNGSQWTWLDVDKRAPGFTPLMVGDLPTHMVRDAADPRWMHVTLALKSELVSLQLEDLKAPQTSRRSLPFQPAGLLSVKTPSRRLYLADPEGGRVWRMDVADLPSDPTPISVGGSPMSLTAVGDKLYVGHRDQAQVTVISQTTGEVVKRISLRSPCQDGIDNDGDGKTDGADEGCDDRDDPFEGDPEVGANCGDKLDNDGDGLTDLDDPGCAVTPKEDACRDGIDNDGDGLTDYPDDPGCLSYASSSEDFDAPSCADGLDNDGDGLTDQDDGDCADDADGEWGTLLSSVTGACGDGIDNDGDGLTDGDDPQCTSTQSDAEATSPCDDGVDNDGDGLIDLADPACEHRGSPSEVSPDSAPVSAVVSSFGGGFVAVTDQHRSAVYLIDAVNDRLLLPTADEGFSRPSKLNARDDAPGIRFESPPVAIAPITLEGNDAFAVATRLGGLMYITLKSAAPATAGQGLAIGLLASSAQQESSASRPSLVIEDAVIDLGVQAPERYAHFGTLNLQTQPSGNVSYYGWTLDGDPLEHRSELWKVRAGGEIPGSVRARGQLSTPDTLRDPEVDFCRLGVVPGDLLVLEAPAKECPEVGSGPLRYTIVEVGPQHLKVDPTSGRQDVLVTSGNQLSYSPGELVGGLPRSCYPRRSVHYSVRADGWLVEGSRTGLLSRRERRGGLCEPWSNSDPLMASRIGNPVLKDAADASKLSCPLQREQLALFHTLTYDTGAGATFRNAVWSASLFPGCVPQDNAGQPPALLPPIHGSTWSYVIATGFTPVVASIGANPVAIQSAPNLGVLWVADQGTGALHTVTAGANFTSSTLD